MSKHRAWVADICDVFVNDGVRAASTTDGGNSFSFGAVSVPVVVASKSVSSSSRSISIHLKPDKVNKMLCTDYKVLFRNFKLIDRIKQLYSITPACITIWHFLTYFKIIVINHIT
jgi:hypothetical protein